MAARANSVNPSVLVWARERAGLSIEEVAEMVGKSAEAITAWEAGEDFPTYRQLETLAARCYKRPVAVFFFPAPPSEKDLETEFRTLPATEFAKLEADTRYALREARAFQDSLREISGGKNPVERQILKDVEPSLEEPPAAIANRVREYLAVPLAVQHEWRDDERGFKEWRSVLESAGVYIFKRSFDQNEVSGFCLHDLEFPVIMVNNSTSFARQTFTLFHELAHLLYRVSGITTEDAGYIDSLQGFDRTIEISCNRFAADFLVPKPGFPWQQFRGRFDLDATVAEIARRYSVSREVILRRLLDEGVIDSQKYAALAGAWNRDFRRAEGKASGGNYYLTQLAYLGDAYLRLAFSSYHAGRLTLPELSDHLRVKARNIGALEEHFNRRGS